MKPTYLLLTLALALSTCLYAKDPKPLPDFTKAFPQGKLFEQTKLSGVETYGYSTDLPFKELKKKFMAFLGKGWMEVKTGHEEKKATDEIMKSKGLTLEGHMFFTHPDYPKIQIGLTQIKMQIEGKKFMASITVINSAGLKTGN